MGRLFQYNRFGRQDNANKKDMPARCSSKTKELNDSSRRSGKYRTLVCPSYSELYPEFKTINGTTTKPSTTSSSTSSSSKSMETAIRKYQQWSSRFLTGCQATTTASATTEDAPKSTSSSLRYQSQRQTAGVQRTKVYDCMKDFLKRKLFQQPAEESAKLAAEREDDEATSDYDEIDVLDSSYNADEEYDSDSTSSSCTCLVTDHEEDDEKETKVVEQEAAPGLQQKPTKSSLNCWPNATPIDSSSASCSSSDDNVDDDHHDVDDDSDAGISDCCHLLSDKSPKRRSGRQTKQKRLPRFRYNRTDDDEEELLQEAWYQPQLSSKAVIERLQHETPGAFVIRRKAECFELSLRVEAKVKHFVILSSRREESFRFKGAKKQFSSLKALVTHHSVMAEQLPMTLKLSRAHDPPQDTRSSTRCPDDFDTFESLQILGILQRMQAENLDFS